jgi:hypothetical protein
MLAKTSGIGLRIVYQIWLHDAYVPAKLTIKISPGFVLRGSRSVHNNGSVRTAVRL